MFKEIKNLFRRKPSKIDQVCDIILSGEYIKDLAGEQSRVNQEEYWKHKEIERDKRLREKYSFWKFTSKKRKLKPEEEKEFEYLKYYVTKASLDKAK